MSYYPPPQGQPPYGQYPPPQHPQQGYQQPPPVQYQQYPPLQPHSPYPAQQYQQASPGQYGAPPSHQGYNQPPGGQYGQPPPQQQYSQPPPQQHYGQPPPGQYGAPPPGQYGQPPPVPPHPSQQQHYGAPPPQQGYGAPPPQQHYGQPPPQQQYGPPTPVSIGYVPDQTAPMNVSAEVEGLHKAMKGFGTDEKALIRILAKQDPIQINTIRAQFNQRFMKNLASELERETSGYFEKGLVQIARGPLTSDAYNLYEAMKGMGTKEAVLDDVLAARSNADMTAIKAEYQRLFHKTLESDLRGDLSGTTEDMFVMIISATRAEDSIPPNPQQTEHDVAALQSSMGSMVGKNPIQTCEVLVKRNDAQLRAIMQLYQQKFGRPLESVVKDKFSGHMEDTLLLILARAKNRIESDARQLEDSMAGLGTKDTLLVQRVVRMHWNRQHMQQVRQEYQRIYRRDLVKRIEGETRGDYERLMVACVQ